MLHRDTNYQKLTEHANRFYEKSTLNNTVILYISRDFTPSPSFSVIHSRVIIGS